MGCAFSTPRTDSPRAAYVFQNAFIDWNRELNIPVNQDVQHINNYTPLRELDSPSRDEQPASRETLETQQCRHIMGLTDNLHQLLVHRQGFGQHLSASKFAKTLALARQSAALIREMQTGLDNGSLLSPATYRQRLTALEQEFMQLTARE